MLSCLFLARPRCSLTCPRVATHSRESHSVARVLATGKTEQTEFERSTKLAANRAAPNSCERSMDCKGNEACLVTAHFLLGLWCQLELTLIRENCVSDDN